VSTPEPTRLDLREMVAASMWFFVVGLALKLFFWDALSWWVITAPFWSSAFLAVTTKNYTVDGKEKQ
jgi:hypothetical protein